MQVLIPNIPIPKNVLWMLPMLLCGYGTFDYHVFINFYFAFLKFLFWAGEMCVTEAMSPCIIYISHAFYLGLFSHTVIKNSFRDDIIFIRLIRTL